MVFFSIFQYDERDFKNDFVDICSVRRYRWSRVSQQRYKKSKKVKKRLDLYGKSLVYSDMTKGENMKNMVVNAFGDLVERTDYGNHKNQLNLFDNLNEIVEENRTADNILDFLFNRKPTELTQDLIQVNGELG